MNGNGEALRRKYKRALREMSPNQREQAALCWIEMVELSREKPLVVTFTHENGYFEHGW